MIHSGKFTPIGLVVELGSTARSSIITDNKYTDLLTLSFVTFCFVTFCFVTLYEDEGHHQHLLFLVGVPAAGFLRLLFGVETGDGGIIVPSV